MKQKHEKGGRKASFPAFEIDRTRWGSLSDQIADGFRNAVRTGFYHPGDILPGRRELAARFGVSVRVVTRAFGRLADEGLVVGRPGIGCRVLPGRASPFKGMVLLIVPHGDFMYYSNVRVGRVHQRLAEEGYCVMRVTVHHATEKRTYDFRQLDMMLKQSLRLIVLMDGNETIERRVIRARVPYVAVGTTTLPSPARLAHIGFATARAFADAAHAARHAGVRTAAFFGVAPLARTRRSAARWIRAGLDLSLHPVSPVGERCEKLDAVVRASRAFFRDFLARRTPLPDLLVFSDEYRLTGAALALAEAGLKVPRDVRLVGIANAGNVPVLPYEISYIEFDPAAHGETVAAALLDYLSHGTFRSVPALELRYVSGDSL